jgi:hypothetical protein
LLILDETPATAAQPSALVAGTFGTPGTSMCIAVLLSIFDCFSDVLDE